MYQRRFTLMNHQAAIPQNPQTLTVKVTAINVSCRSDRVSTVDDNDIKLVRRVTSDPLHGILEEKLNPLIIVC